MVRRTDPGQPCIRADNGPGPRDEGHDLCAAVDAQLDCWRPGEVPVAAVTMVVYTRAIIESSTDWSQLQHQPIGVWLQRRSLFTDQHSLSDRHTKYTL